MTWASLTSGSCGITFSRSSDASANYGARSWRTACLRHFDGRRHRQNRHQVLRVQTGIHVSQDHGPISMGGIFRKCTIQFEEEIDGKKVPRNFPKATLTAALVPVWITRKASSRKEIPKAARALPA